MFYLVPNFESLASEHIIPSELDEVSFRDSLKAAFALSSTVVEGMRGGGDPIMKELGTRSYAAVVRQAYFVMVYESDGAYRWLEFRRGVKFRSFTPVGFFDDGEVVESIDDLARGVLAFFAACN